MSRALEAAFVLHVVGQVIQADGVVDPREQVVVDHLLPRARLVEAGLVDSLGQRTERYADLVGEALVILPLRLGPDEKLALLDQLMAAAMADGELHREESWVIAHAARLLGLSAAAYEAWLGQHRAAPTSEQALRDALVVHLLDRLIAADGVVDEAERELVERLAPAARLRSHGFLDEAGRTPRLDGAIREALAYLPLHLSNAGKRGLLDELYDAALADGVLHREEVWVLADAARALGLSGTEFDAWLADKPGAVPRAEVLSYSAGSTQTGPDGYRKLGRGPDLRRLFTRWPDLVDAIGDRTFMVLNAYPAALGNFDYAVFIDTYLSPKTASRALQLAAREGRPVVLLGQPLLLAEMILRHVAADRPLPDLLIGAVGGYACPASLERALRVELEGRTRFELVQGYGAAEVDAGLLFARHRTADGELVYEARGPDAIVERSPEGGLLLGLRAPDGQVLQRGFDTGDRVELHPGGFLIRNGSRRLHPEVAAELARWTVEDWRRRTGYMSRSAGRFQLRDGERPRDERELAYHDFAGRFPGTWLAKPDWS